MGDAHENIKVVVRVRPFNDLELSRGDKKIVCCNHDGKSLRVEGGAMDDFGKASQLREFTFNTVMDEGEDQKGFFEKCGVQQLVTKALGGYSATIFAYGQTGSGKTYCVSGKEEVIVDDSYTGGHDKEGMVPRAARQICEAMDRATDCRYNLKAACFEIYNEQVLDLLNPDSGQLQIRESKAQGFFVENLLVVECSAVTDLMEVFKEGTRNRHVASHTLNRDSSRSHSVLVMYVDRITTDPESGEELTQYGKLTFVDLAGSERLKYSGSSGEMMKETGSINRSLFTLGKVISTLDKNESFVPYRESKLTKLLMDSLGGTSSCVMVACCSPSAKYTEETLNTLQYAYRAKNIQNSPVIQMDSTQRLVLQLRQEVERLKAENLQLRQDRGLPAPIDHKSLRLSAASRGPSGGDAASPRSSVGPPRQSSSGRLAYTARRSSDTTPRFDSAVGYAEGYAAGLEQAKEVVYSNGLDVTRSIEGYDLSRSLGGTGARPRSSGRLPPLAHAATDPDMCGGVSSKRRSVEMVDAADLYSGEDGVKMLESLRLANEMLEERNNGLSKELARLQRALEEQMRSSGDRDRGMHGPSPSEEMMVLQKAMVDRLQAENAELRKMLQQQLPFASSGGGPIGGAPTHAMGRGGPMAPHLYRDGPGSSSHQSMPGGAGPGAGGPNPVQAASPRQRQLHLQEHAGRSVRDNNMFYSTEGPIWHGADTRSMGGSNGVRYAGGMNADAGVAGGGARQQHAGGFNGGAAVHEYAGRPPGMAYANGGAHAGWEGGVPAGPTRGAGMARPSARDLLRMEGGSDKKLPGRPQAANSGVAPTAFSDSRGGSGGSAGGTAPVLADRSPERTGSARSRKREGQRDAGALRGRS